MIEIKTYSKPKKTGGSGGSSSPTKYISGVISEAEHAGRADKAKRAEVADQANYAGTAASAQNAAYASEAGNLHADAEILQKYLSLEATKDPQVVKGQVKFEQLLQLLQGFSLGNICGFDGSGNGIINSVSSNGFNSASQQGFGIKPDDNGRYSLSITDLIVWGKAVFNELEIRKLSYAGGNVYLSGAGSKLVKVVPVAYNEETGGYITSTDEECDGWKCYILADDGTMATQNWWAVGDQARCQTFNIKPGAYNNASNKEYWRCVVAVSSESEFIVNDEGESLYGDKKFDWVILSKTNCLTGSDIPAEGDAIVLDGHQVQTGDEGSISRTNVLMLETTGADTPRIVGYRGITDFTHEGKDVFVISPSNVTISSSVFKFKTVSGQTITIINDRGAYDPSVGYYYYDRVSYDNAYWTLIYSGDKQPVKGITPTEEAVNGIVYWRKDLSGGIKGDDAVIYTLEASPGYIRLSSDGSIDYTNGYINKGDEYGSDKYLVVRGYKVVKGVRDNRFSTEASPVTLRLTINDGSAYSEYTPSDGDSVSIDFEPKYEDSYYSMLEEISHSGLNSVRVDLCEGSEYNPNKILATCDIPIIRDGKDGQKGDDGASYNINFVTHKDDVHNDTLLYVYVVRSVGKESTSTLISKIPEISETAGLEVRVYCDGDYNENLTNHVKWSGSIQRSAWETVKNFEVRLYLDDKLVSSNSYSFGEQGTDGKDAVSILVEDAPLVFDTDDNGIVSPSVTKTAKVKVMRGNINVTNDCNQESSRDDLSSNCKCSVTQKNGYIEVSVSGGHIVKNDVIIDGVNKGTVSTTSGYAVAQFVYDSVVYFAQVPFSVNVAKFTGSVAFDNKGYKAQFDALSKNAATKEELTQVTSKFEQTAREISLSVSEKSIGRRNLLVGSAFNRQEGFGLLLDANVRGYGILMNDGVDGMNCIKVASYYDGTRYQYCGAFWGGNHTKNIRIKHRTQYTFSCWVKVLDANTTVYLEVIYNKAEIGEDRDGRPTGTYYFVIREPNKWQLVKWSFTTDDTHDWIEANVFTSSNVAYKTFVASFCKPMLAEGDYNGWTLSQDDYEYIGGNMLDNTLSLDKSGSLYDVNGTLTPAGFGESTSIYKSFTYKLKGTVDSFSQLPSSGNVYNDTYFVRNEVTCYVYNGSEFIKVTGNDSYYNILEWRKGKPGAITPFGLEANKDYVFSFMAKGTGVLTAYFYNPETDVFVESSLGATNISVDGNANFQLTNKWERYWVHWRPSDSLHKYVLLRLNRSFQSDGSAPITDCYIAQPKLEEGARVTEYTERKSDLVDKASLKAAGILVDAESVTLYGNQVHIKKNKTDADDTVLIDNETGKVSAGLIDADEVVAKGIRAKNLEATNLNVTGNSRFGIWEIVKDDTFGEMIQARGDLTLPSGTTASGSGINYLPLYIRGGIADVSYFRVGVSCTEFSYRYGNDFCGVWTGKAADYVCGGTDTVFNTPTGYDYNTSYHPAEYIYATKSSPNDPAFAINVVKTMGSSDGTRTAIQTNGAIRGVLAPNAMSISRDRTIPNDIGVVICTNDSEMTLKLPVNPLEGQTLIIIQGSTSRVYIVPSGNAKIYCHGQTRDNTTKFYSGTIGQFNIFVYVRGAWQLQWMNYQP